MALLRDEYDALDEVACANIKTTFALAGHVGADRALDYRAQ